MVVAGLTQRRCFPALFRLAEPETLYILRPTSHQEVSQLGIAPALAASGDLMKDKQNQATSTQGAGLQLTSQPFKKPCFEYL